MTDSKSNLPAALGAPHRTIEVANARERFAVELFDNLWTRYHERVSYVRQYEQVVVNAKGNFVNDHIAFRTIAGQNPLTGISGISRVFEALGYLPAGNYSFTDKSLGSIHYQHSNPKFPKLFITELKTWELPADARAILERTTRSHRPMLPAEKLAALWNIDKQSEKFRRELLDDAIATFSNLPWDVPQKADVVAINKVSQFAAWVMVHGYDVNHFTAFVNSHGVASLDDIDKTVAAMKQAGVPMKAEIEGVRGSKLRQTATEAVTIDVAVRDGAQLAKMPWTYAYFEIAERNNIKDPETGVSTRFEGFLGPQATQLFEMTRVK